MTMPPKRVRRAPARRPEPPRETVRFPVLAVVFVCAACGLVYELELVALASYLIGDSVTQASVVLSVMVFAMGVGSLLAKRLRCRAAVGFGLVEAGLALVGGCSAMVLYAAFAWLGESRYVLVAFSLAIGVLIGAEIPLLMSLIQRDGRPGRTGRKAPTGRRTTPPGRSPTSSPPTTSAHWSAASPFPFCCCPGSASSPAPSSPARSTPWRAAASSSGCSAAT